MNETQYCIARSPGKTSRMLAEDFLRNSEPRLTVVRVPPAETVQQYRDRRYKETCEQLIREGLVENSRNYRRVLKRRLGIPPQSGEVRHVV